MRPLNSVKIISSVHIPIGNADDAIFITFEGLSDDKEHFAIKLGEGTIKTPPLVRIHSECVTGDVFQSSRCDCGMQLNEAIKMVNEHGGYILYLRQEGRGIGLIDKLKAYNLQDIGLDTYQANQALGHSPDGRNYDIAVQMLSALNINEIKLLTNNPQKIKSLEDAGINILSKINTTVFIEDKNIKYLKAKYKVGGHTIKESIEPFL